METIDNNYGKLAFKSNTNTCFWGTGLKHATFIKYRLNQIIKSKCASDGAEMKIIIQWVT